MGDKDKSADTAIAIFFVHINICVYLIPVVGISWIFVIGHRK